MNTLLALIIGLSIFAVVVAPEATLLLLFLIGEFVVAIVLTAVLRTAKKEPISPLSGGVVGVSGQSRGAGRRVAASVSSKEEE